jgi:putative (di)nucleoside polyphosphate hydrolase
MSRVFKLVDQDGYRSNVAMVISNGHGQVFWAKRMGQKAWQFPQGGIDQGETTEQALYRELYEEVGLKAEDVKIIHQTKRWLRYNIPEKMQRKYVKPRCIGQKQRWFFLQLIGDQKNISFDRTGSPEFDAWEWVSYWHPINQVVSFKQSVYRQALSEFSQTNARFQKRRKH